MTASSRVGKTKKEEEKEEEEEEEEGEGISEFRRVQQERGRQYQEGIFLSVRVRVTGPRPRGTRATADQYIKRTWARVATEQYEHGGGGGAGWVGGGLS